MKESTEEAFLKAQGRAFKEARSKTRLSQSSAASKCGHGKQWLSDIENGRNNIMFYDAYRLCEIYGISIKELSDNIHAQISESVQPK